LLPVIGSDEKQIAFIKKIKQELIKSGISNKVDETGVSIGRRYARTDELGIPFAITVDPETSNDLSVTLREIETTKQIRVKIDEVVRLVWELAEGITTWS
jgi:glycyl-tRNA synthetase